MQIMNSRKNILQKDCFKFWLQKWHEGGGGGRGILREMQLFVPEMKQNEDIEMVLHF